MFRTARSPNVLLNNVFSIATARVEARCRTLDIRTRLELPPEAIVFTIGIDKQGLSREPHHLLDSLQYLYHALTALDTVFDQAIVAEEAGNVWRKEAGDSITQYVEWTNPGSASRASSKK